MSLPDPRDDPTFYDHVQEKRFAAWVLDLAVTLIVVVVIAAMSAGLALFILPFVWSATAIAYRTVMLTRYSATLGMLLVALRLRKLDGTRPDQSLCLGYSIMHAVSMVFVLPQIGSVAMMLISPWRQGLNDWLLGTVMINRPLD